MWEVLDKQYILVVWVVVDLGSESVSPAVIEVIRDDGGWV